MFCLPRIWHFPYPGGPVAKTLCLQCRGAILITGQGTGSCMLLLKDLTCCSEDQRSCMPQRRPSAVKQDYFKNISHESLEQWLAWSNFPLWHLKGSLGVGRENHLGCDLHGWPWELLLSSKHHPPHRRYISPPTLRMMALGSPHLLQGTSILEILWLIVVCL